MDVYSKRLLTNWKCRSGERWRQKDREEETAQRKKGFIHSHVGTGFPLASHSMMMLSLGSTMQSFSDCFTMVGGCFTVEGGTKRESYLNSTVEEHSSYSMSCVHMQALHFSLLSTVQTKQKVVLFTLSNKIQIQLVQKEKVLIEKYCLFIFHHNIQIPYRLSVCLQNILANLIRLLYQLRLSQFTPQKTQNVLKMVQNQYGPHKKLREIVRCKIQRTQYHFSYYATWPLCNTNFVNGLQSATVRFRK